MLRLYLAEQQAAGDPVLLTTRSVDGFRALASSYLTGSLFGIVVLAETPKGPAGFVLVGEQPGQPMLDTTLGRVANVWIAWTPQDRRKGGVALAMLSFGRPYLVEMGFKTASMSVRADNERGRRLSESFGAVLAEHFYTFPLAEQPAHLKR